MNKGLYKHIDRRSLYWYESWKNSAENSGATILIWDEKLGPGKWTWSNSEDDEEDCGTLVGAACLVQW